ncbi:hypothetical protein D3C85_812350 [compost metagenome]
MDKFKKKVCADKDCSNEFKQFNSLHKYCSPSCTNKNRKVNLKLKPLCFVPKVSKKRKELNRVYQKVRIEVLTEANFKCFIDGCANVANTIEHTAGRLGFYDEQARIDNIPLIIDKRFLKACCFTHNGELENNPELSKKYQLSKITGKPKN